MWGLTNIGLPDVPDSAGHPGFQPVSRVPAEPFQGRELSRIWSIAGLIINFLFSAVSASFNYKVLVTNELHSFV
jgi:hypothetical protein